MGIEGFSSSKWPGLVRLQNSKRGSLLDSKRYEKGKVVQSTEAASRRKLVLLHDWWLVKAGPDSHGKRLGLGGFTLNGNQGLRCFSSASIFKRHDAVTLQTVDGITLMVHGYLNRSRTLENGFSQEVCDHFVIGFPYYWEDFAAISDNEEPVPRASEGVSPSDAYKTPARGSNMMSEASSAKKKRTCVPIQSMDSADLAGGPLTRSRARLLATRRR